MSDRWQFVTPEVTRPPTMAYTGRPGEETIGAKRLSPKKSPGKGREAPKTRWSAFKRVLKLVPWGALLAFSFLMTGLIIYLVHAKNAANESIAVLDFIQSENVGYPHRVHVFAGSYAVTAGLAGGCMLGAIILALVRLRQKLAKENRSSEIWGRFKFNLLFNISILSFCGIVLPLIWFMLNLMFLSAWGMALWTIRESATAASISMQQMDPTVMGNINLMEPVQADNLVCPSGACFNMNYFTWLESNSCLCTQQLISGLQDSSRTALSSVMWSLGAVGCLLCGALIATAQGSADLALMRSDWTWSNLLLRYRSSRTPSRRPPMDMYSKDSYALTPGAGMPKRPIYQVNTGGGYYVQDPGHYPDME